MNLARHQCIFHYSKTHTITHSTPGVDRMYVFDSYVLCLITVVRNTEEQKRSTPLLFLKDFLEHVVGQHSINDQPLFGHHGPLNVLLC